MTEQITIEISETAARIVHEIAARTGRPASAVISDLVDRSVAELPVDNLPDDEVLALCDMALPDSEQAELTLLLNDQRENQLDTAGQARLEILMQLYRHGLVRKSEALRVAVQRGLHPSLA